MPSVNPFDLLVDDVEDPSQLAAAKPLKVEKAAPVQPAKLPSKPLPPSQAVREAKNGPAGVRGFNRNNDGRGSGYGRGRGGGFNRDSRNNDAPANGNGYGGGNRPSEEGDGARRGGSVGGYHGGGRVDRRGGYSNGYSGRNFDRHSGTGHENEFKHDGTGRANWGTNEDEVSPPLTEESTTVVVEKNVAVEKQGGEDEATDANKVKLTKEQAREQAERDAERKFKEEERERESKMMTLEQYEKVLEEKKKDLQTSNIEERKVDTKAFESMQQLSSKKSNNDDVFIKLGSEKDKRTFEREEKAKKSLSINEFLKLANGESNQRGGFRGGRGGRGSREGVVGGRGPKEGGNQRHGSAAAPAIEDTAQFPTLGK